MKKTNQLKEINKMDKIRSYKTLIEYINNIHDIKLTKKDLYRKKGFLFVNIKKYNTVEIFDYPVNNLIEVGNHITNWNNKNIKDMQKNSEVANFNQEYVTEMLDYWDNNLTNVFRRQKDILVADAVLEMFRRRENIENFNKKALYILIREMTGSKTQHITRIVNLMKKYNMNLMTEFRNTGQIDTANTGSFL